MSKNWKEMVQYAQRFQEIILLLAQEQTDKTNQVFYDNNLGSPLLLSSNEEKIYKHQVVANIAKLHTHASWLDNPNAPIADNGINENTLKDLAKELIMLATMYRATQPKNQREMTFCDGFIAKLETMVNDAPRPNSSLGPTK